MIFACIVTIAITNQSCNDENDPREEGSSCYFNDWKTRDENCKDENNKTRDDNRAYSFTKLNFVKIRVGVCFCCFGGVGDKKPAVCDENENVLPLTFACFICTFAILIISFIWGTKIKSGNEGRVSTSSELEISGNQFNSPVYWDGDKDGKRSSDLQDSDYIKQNPHQILHTVKRSSFSYGTRQSIIFLFKLNKQELICFLNCLVKRLYRWQIRRR